MCFVNVGLKKPKGVWSSELRGRLSRERWAMDLGKERTFRPGLEPFSPLRFLGGS